MSKVFTNQYIEEDIKDILEDTFDLCKSNREEIYWLITIFRAFMKVPNKEKKMSIDNMHLNEWQYNIVPIIEQLMKKWKL